MTSAAMGRAFTGLLARPAVLLFGIAWLTTTLLASEYARRTGSWLLIAFVSPLPTGMIAGQLIQELQHTTFAWTLPRVRQSMVLPLSLMALAWAGGIAVVVSMHGPASNAGTSAPLVYAAVAALGLSCGVGLLDPVYGWKGALPCLSGAIIVGVAHAARELPASAGVLTTMAALGVAAWSLQRTVSMDALRRRPSTPMLTLADSHLRGSMERFRREKLAAARRVTATVWRNSLVDAGTGLWVRAAFYEASGTSRAINVRRIVTGLVAAAIILLLPLVRLSWTAVGRLQFQRLVTPTEDGHFWLALLVGFLVISPFGSPVIAAGLQPGLHHPLSRPQRARVTWTCHLLLGAQAGCVAALFLGGFAVFASKVAGLELPGGRLPGFVAPLAFAISLVPFVAWRSERAALEDARRQSPATWSIVNVLLSVLSIAGMVVTSVLSSRYLAGLHPLVQWGTCAAWITASFGGHRWRVARYYRQSDLI